MSETSKRLAWQTYTLKLKNPFRLAYGASLTRTAHILNLEDGSGLGEGTIAPYYGIDTSRMAAYWRAVTSKDAPFPDDPAEIPAWIGTEGPPPARAALDLALHDRIARREGKSLSGLLGLPRSAGLTTSFTISIAKTQEMAQLAAVHTGFPILKIKLGGTADLDRLKAVRAARPDARLWVDANAAWSREEAMALLPSLENQDVELLEQPLAKDDIEGLGMLQKKTRIQIVADESVQTLEDVDRLARAGVTAINLKLMKAGGIAPSLAMVKLARDYGMRLMLGCMIETSLGITAAAHLGGLVDWIDLDAPLLISNDPVDGIRFDRHAVGRLPERNGIGVELKVEVE